jgi:hypothetical protein
MDIISLMLSWRWGMRSNTSANLPGRGNARSRKTQLSSNLNPLTKLKKAQNQALAKAVQRYGKFLGLAIEMDV